MFRWRLPKWGANKAAPTLEPGASADFPTNEWGEIANEWDYLRAQPDHDEDEMAAVRGTAPQAFDPVTVMEPEPVVAAPPALLEDDPKVIRTGGPLRLEITLADRKFTAEVEDTALVGRVDEELGIRPEIDLSGDDGVSRRHARFYNSGGVYMVQDLNSLNGTCLNGRWMDPIKGVPVREDDEIEIAETVLIRVLAPEMYGYRPSAPAATSSTASNGSPMEFTPEDRKIRDLLAAAVGDEPREEIGSSFQAPGYVSSSRLPGEPGCDVLETALICGERAGLYLPEPAAGWAPSEPATVAKRAFIDQFD